MADYRSIPSVDKVLHYLQVTEAADGVQHDDVVKVTRSVLDDIRRDVGLGAPAPSFEAVIQRISTQIYSLTRSSLRRVINATGVIIHTNLGRAPLSNEAVQAVENAAVSYSNLELELDSGERGSRQSHVESLLCQLTGAQAALAVNNNAAAVLLGLNALASGKEIIISRSQAVEIGGGFRIPDVMKSSGAALIDVGTTNRTYISDYEEAITPDTGAMMRVHSSNFKIVGFTHSPDLKEMSELASRRGILLLDDLGSGCLLDTSAFGMDREPTVQDSVAAGADATFFSGDKLLGGPQAGIIVGNKGVLDTIKRHPMARAARIDKLSLAALSATLLHYIKGEAYEKIPVWRMISAPLSELERRAHIWMESLGNAACVMDNFSTVGGGSLPGSLLHTKVLAVPQKALGEGHTLDELATLLRRRDNPVVPRIEKDFLILDPRTVLPEEDSALVRDLHESLGKVGVRGL